jgi:hypothetical protein
MTSHTLVKGMSQVHVGFRPHDMGVKVKLGFPDGTEHVYHPVWCLVAEMQSRTEFPGPPEFWCTDGHRVYFDKPADADYAVEAESLNSQEQTCPIG